MARDRSIILFIIIYLAIDYISSGDIYVDKMGRIMREESLSTDDRIRVVLQQLRIANCMISVLAYMIVSTIMLGYDMCRRADQK